MGKRRDILIIEAAVPPDTDIVIPHLLAYRACLGLELRARWRPFANKPNSMIRRLRVYDRYGKPMIIGSGIYAGLLAKHSDTEEYCVYGDMELFHNSVVFPIWTRYVAVYRKLSDYRPILVQPSTNRWRPAPGGSPWVVVAYDPMTHEHGEIIDAYDPSVPQLTYAADVVRIAAKKKCS